MDTWEGVRRCGREICAYLSA